MTQYHIVALSHLAWERKLFQRPQQLMKCFSELGHQVSYFSLVGLKRYLNMNTEDRLDEVNERLFFQNLPFFPLSHRFEICGKLSLSFLKAKALPYMRDAPTGKRVLWLQNPHYIALVDRIPHDILIYDAMDPFRAFKNSKPHVVEEENRLLKEADLVFTGGRSLNAQIEDLHDNIHCYPSGIDFDHFSRGAEEGPIPKSMAKIQKPVLGYFGAVDERIDWDLIQHICRERRNWSIVFIGPLVLMDKIPIDEPNFHWLGPKKYDYLPKYLRTFDVCLIPWLVNDLTKFMSPTKTPEYLAAGRPVVSTPIPDVCADYSEEVLIAKDPDEYLTQCTKALRQGVGKAYRPPQSMSWMETAEAMIEKVDETLTR